MKNSKKKIYKVPPAPASEDETEQVDPKKKVNYVGLPNAKAHKIIILDSYFCFMEVYY